MTFSNGTRVTMARDLAPLVKLLGDETIRRGYNIRSGVTGGYNCRPIRGGSSYSNHAFALAIDINWDKNPMSSRLVTDMPRWMVDLWKSYGFRWGGDYRTRKDAMHYEFLGTPADARRMADRARREFGSSTPPTTPPTGAHRMTATRHRRLYDSRQHGKVRNGQKIALSAPSPKPSWAQAVLVNVTLFDVDGPCHAESIWSEGDTSICNNDGGVFANANLAVIPFNGNQFTVKVVGGPAHVLVDFQGWSEADL